MWKRVVSPEHTSNGVVDMTEGDTSSQMLAYVPLLRARMRRAATHHLYHAKITQGYPIWNSSREEFLLLLRIISSF